MVVVGEVRSVGAEPEAPTIPARMINEVVYCPRLFALEWTQREWADSAETVEGRWVHRRVDQEAGAVPAEVDPERPVSARSVMVGSLELGIVARVDLLESEGEAVIPIDYKRGEAPEVPEGAWEPERVQVCAQGLALRASGYRCDEGMLYFAASRRRVRVAFDEALITRTLAARDEARRIALAGELPPPLVDSPKCRGCSLVGICLPDEHNLLAGRAGEVRPLLPARDDGLPLYVMRQGGALGKDHGEIVVRDKTGEVGRARIAETSRVVLWGNVSVSTPLLRELADADIPVSLHTYGGWHIGTFVPAHGRNVITRMAQHRAAGDPVRALRIAQAFVRSKIRNQRVFLRRNGEGVPEEALLRMKEMLADVDRAEDIGSLMGVEGGAARIYFQHFARTVRGELREVFRFDGRNRRPPRDPANALLSFAYACLVRELVAITGGIGLDPYVGFLHQPRYGRPALALDLMEEFRPVLCDSAVVNAINNEVVKAGDFVVRAQGVALTEAARGRFVEVFERRMDELATHPTFGTRLSYRRILEVQARLLGKVLTGELGEYPEYRIR